MFAVKNRFANPKIQTLSPQIVGWRAVLRKCPALILGIWTKEWWDHITLHIIRHYLLMKAVSLHGSNLEFIVL